MYSPSGEDVKCIKCRWVFFFMATDLLLGCSFFTVSGLVDAPGTWLYHLNTEKVRFSWYVTFNKRFITNTACGLLTLLVNYCDVFISCLDSHSDGTHSLQRIHWWANYIKLNFSKSVPMKKKLIYILDCLRVSKIYTTFHFWVTFPLNSWSFLLTLCQTEKNGPFTLVNKFGDFTLLICKP